MKQVTVLAPAKLNLALDVVGLLPNGYHDLDMVMQTITLYERLTLRRAEEVQLRLPGSWVPVNEKNTAVKAARAFFRYTGLADGVDMEIENFADCRRGVVNTLVKNGYLEITEQKIERNPLIYKKVETSGKVF